MPVTRISEFDTWQTGYGLATVLVLRAATSTPADLFADEACTVTAPNPQRLVERMSNGVSAGKFAAPLYTKQAYQLQINSVDSTGIMRPSLTTLEGEDASKALATADGATVAHPLEAYLARSVQVENYGVFAPVGDPLASPDGNTNALAQAIGAAAMAGVQYVDLPAGTFDLAPFTIPTGVVVRGQGREKTILQCGQGGKFVTVTGTRAGVMSLTLDGKSKVVTSVGLYGVGRDQVVLSDAEIKRFEFGVEMLGGQLARFRDSDISDCSIGAWLKGDNANIGGALGSSLQSFAWRGGKVSYCSTAGILLEYENMPVIETVFDGLGFVGNTQIALQVKGARNTTVRGCWFETNTTNLDVRGDDAGTPNGALLGLEVEACRLVAGKVMIWNNTKGILFRRCILESVAIELTGASAPVIAEDCEEKAVTLSQIGNYWMRRFAAQRGQTVGVTTSATPAAAWSLTLQPGQCVNLIVKVIGRARNAAKRAFYQFGVAAYRGYDTLSYDAQTGQFTPGNVITGSISGASARVVVDTDGGTTGTLQLQDVQGAFQDNELITDGVGGSATVNGFPVGGSVTVLTSNVILPPQETVAAWDAAAVASGGSVDIRVTGEAATTVEWVVDVDITSS